jgi:hypothetical protein
MDGGASKFDPNTVNFQLAQLSVERITEKLAELSYNLSIEHCFRNLKKHLADQGAVVNPSFDADEHDLESAFWLRVADDEGRTIACHAERVYETSDFVGEYIKNGRLWWQRSPAIAPESWRDEINPPPIKISGTVAYAGAMLVNKAHRGRGLSVLLPHLSRALCLKNYRTHFHTGIVRQSLANSIIPTANYGFTRTTPIFNGTLPGLVGPREQVHLCWMNTNESFYQLENLSFHPKFPVDLNNRASDTPSSARQIRPS